MVCWREHVLDQGPFLPHTDVLPFAHKMPCDCNVPESNSFDDRYQALIPV